MFDRKWGTNFLRTIFKNLGNFSYLSMILTFFKKLHTTENQNNTMVNTKQ